MDVRVYDKMPLLQKINKEISNTLSKLPQKPGVYWFLNKEGEVIYIGKAINLRRRVRSYFNPNKHIHKKQINLNLFKIYTKSILKKPKVTSTQLFSNLRK